MVRLPLSVTVPIELQNEHHVDTSKNTKIVFS
jgi:hypothetical protein